MASSRESAISDRVLKSVEVGDTTVLRAEGGETHQISHGIGAVPLTTRNGMPISDNQNSLRAAGGRGPLLMEDMVFREKIFAFDHERIPERVVHARGTGAHGVFTCKSSLSDITCADLFQKAGQQTEVFVRFSTVAGSKGSTDLARDVRGFATKFYTKEGNWDLVGNNIPVFFIQDPIKFPDMVHALKEEPDTGFPQAATAHDSKKEEILNNNNNKIFSQLTKTKKRCLGLLIANPGKYAYGHVGNERSRHSSIISIYGGFWRSYLSFS